MGKTISFAGAIFQRALDSIEQHQEKHKSLNKYDFKSTKQALDWWDSLPDFAQQSLREHSFLNSFHSIFAFYWGE